MEPQATGSAKRGRGRPKTFDRDAALDTAMRLFWDQGYEGTTFDQLIAAMGISPSSFYNAFGSKERLFGEAAALYVARAGAWFSAALDAGTDARTAFHRLLSASASQYTGDDCPAGCMVALSCTTVPPALDPLRDLMAGLRRSARDAMAERLRRAALCGELALDADPEVLADFFAAVSRGMAISARDGATGAELQAVVDASMQVWPGA